MRNLTASMLLAGAVLIASGAALAYGDGTPDEQPPAEEEICDAAGLVGSAFGLCVAFCEANDCDAFEEPDDLACSMLRERYARLTGQLFLPCEVIPPPVAIP